jgi:hypothetical protein
VYFDERFLAFVGIRYLVGDMLAVTGGDNEVTKLDDLSLFVPEFIGHLPKSLPFEGREGLEFLNEALDDAGGHGVVEVGIEVGEVVADVLVHDVVEQSELALLVGLGGTAGVEQHQRTRLSLRLPAHAFLQQLPQLYFAYGHSTTQ